MWYLRLFVLLGLNAVVILFALANVNETVAVRWLDPQSAGTRMNLTVALLLAYLLGFLTFFLISALRELRLRRRHNQLQRQFEALREELNRLRTAPLDGLLEPPAPEAEAESEAPRG
ncbi:MAG: DUF1049 domain-containing protein [Candidatus Eisenbacteria bacterium]|uniref:DUF1049 domain-containing protein n=1 Tax=Eiseniibacteriota bacterium TaxID=2212470 RepID=A0A938BQ86_UNCEI|nr:DUF1049 domain-containing protein [Candidatus Eisenbacteria bacterium]